MKHISLFIPLVLMGCLQAEVHNVDLDIDEDGLMTSFEEEIGTNPENADSDGDGYDDAEEIDEGFDPIDEEDYPYLGEYPIARCDPGVTPTGHAVGQIAEDFALTDQHGETVNLSDFCGKVVLLEASAFW
ncbi:MAG: hypothetical protein CMH56_14365 [Myxococcales bacterium]|nr:hypothetical protein [Myxococcales bacterium]|tara:strand:- start:852 stop:1241 length:390 start_codon:yes stop_codon:yes gene_type:complete